MNRPNKTFADMIEVLKQHAQGLVTDSEAILAVQLHPLQLESLLKLQALPFKAIMKLDIADMEPDYERLEALAQFAAEDQSFLQNGQFYRSRFGRVYQVERGDGALFVDANPTDRPNPFRWNQDGRTVAGFSFHTDDEYPSMDLVKRVDVADFNSQNNAKLFNLHDGCYFVTRHNRAIKVIYTDASAQFPFADEAATDLCWNKLGIAGGGSNHDWDLCFEITEAEFNNFKKA